MNDEQLIIPLEELGRGDVGQVGGKNASLGEMIRHLGGQGVRVPGGFATTAHGYRCFLAENGLEPRIRSLTESFQKKERSLAEVGKDIRSLFLESRMPDAVAEAVRAAYRRFAEQTGREASDVAVRSSATAEDLPEASERTEDKT